MAQKKDLPAIAVLQKAVLEGLKHLGGEASNDQLAASVAQALGIGPELLALKHDDARGNRTEFEYRMAWARTKLKDEGLLEKAGAKRWALRRPT
jgi:restriction system protein